jgi:toxin ParE1/3/4
LQAIARYLRSRNPTAARAFLQAAYDTFEFLVLNPGAGRQRGDLGYEGLRSWRVKGFHRYLIFYRQSPDRIQIWRVLHGSQDLQQRLTGV